MSDSAHDWPTPTRFFLDGEPCEARPGETLWEVAKRHGRSIPYLCHKPTPGYRPDGNCRACVVEVEGETHELTGSAEVQYAQWRALLQRIYVFETGIAAP